MSVLAALLITIVSLLAGILYWATRNLNYWKKKGVPYPKPMPIFGNYAEYILQRKYLGYVTQDICKQFPDEPLVGAYYGTEPALLVQDPEVVKIITTRDFQYFNGRENTEYSHREAFTNNLFFSGGDEWKVSRQHLSPIFTSGKLKSVFPLIIKNVEYLESRLKTEVAKSPIVDMRLIMSFYMVDCLCAAVFGVEGKTLQNEPSGFRIAAERLFTQDTIKSAKMTFRSIWPKIFYSLRLNTTDDELTVFFQNLINNLLKERNYKPCGKNDFIDVMMSEINDQSMSGDAFSKDKDAVERSIAQIAAQCGLFFGAGFETSAGTAAFTLYELARHPQEQEKMYQEVKNYLEQRGGKIEFDCTTELTYTQQCVDETLRRYPVLAIITRETMQDYTLRGVQLEKGTRIHIPVYHMHHLPKYFPDPEKYDPERFAPEAKAKLPSSLYIPFGDGGRQCIGVVALHDVQLSVPAAVGVGASAVLGCRWALDTGETLYTVKWYHGAQEFFRYVPKELPNTRVFSQTGISVDVSRSGGQQVVLRDATLALSGRYRCEVSADAPFFHTVYKSAILRVVELPDSAPVVRTEKSWYSSGDLLRANCSAPASDPPANITWLVNGFEARGLDIPQLEPEFSTRPRTSSRSTLDDANRIIYSPWDTISIYGDSYTEKPVVPTSVFTSRRIAGTTPRIDLMSSKNYSGDEEKSNKTASFSQLAIKIAPDHFRKGRLNVTCEARVFGVWSASASLLLDEERPHIAQVMSSHDSNSGFHSKRSQILIAFLLSLASYSHLHWTMR